MKSYKEAVKSYRDLDKDIILNAPEGAMWWCHRNGYYKYQGSDIYVHYPEECDWFYSANFRKLLSIQEGVDFSSGFLKPIPLPNVEIPWEAAQDSKCPVPDSVVVRVNGLYSSFGKNFWWGIDTEDAQITTYKIIDEDYLPSVATVTITEDSATIEPGVHETLEDKLIKRLEFLQNLANKFPEIKAEAVKFMECELDGYMNTLWEKDNDE